MNPLAVSMNNFPRVENMTLCLIYYYRDFSLGVDCEGSMGSNFSSSGPTATS